jgi:Arm DNA-binding domain
MQKTITDVSLSTLPEGEYWDAKLPSFGVRVGERFTTFLLNKAGRRIKIGRYPALTLADAKKRAHGLKADPETASVTISLKEALRLLSKGGL